MKTAFEDYKIEDLLIKKKRSERAELVKFFMENLLDKKGKHFPVKRIAFKLSHLSLNDLYFFKSVCQDILNRKGSESMNKYFWYSLRA